MTLSVGPKLGLLVHGALGEAHYDQLMAQWRALDTLIQCNVISMALATPPGSPADGATYIVATSPTGAWAGKAANLARWSAVVGAWEFFSPKEGWEAYCLADDLDHKFNGTAWVVASGGMTNPMTAYGDLITGAASGVPQSLAAGTDGQVLKVVSGAPAWTTPGAGSGVVETIVAGTGITVDDTDPANPIVTATASSPVTAIPIACSDEASALTTGTAKVTFRMPFGFTLTGVRASVKTAPTGSELTVDINEGGSSILSTKLTIDASEKTSTTAATPAVISDTALADDAEITIDIDTVGSTVAGAGLKVYLIGTVV